MVPIFDINLLTKMWHLVTTFWISIGFQLPWIREISWIGHGKNNSYSGRWKVSQVWLLWNQRSTTSSLFISKLLCACLHNNFIVWKISRMLNYWVVESKMRSLLLWWLGCNCFVELSIMFLQLQTFLWFYRVVCYVLCKGIIFLAFFNVFFCLLNLMVVL